MGMIQGPEEIQAIVQEQVPEPLLAVGMVQPAGTWGAAGLSQLSGIAGMFHQKSANQKAGDLTNRGAFFRSGKSPNSQTIVGLTADTLYAFEAKYGWGGMKLKGQLAAWPRKDLTVRLEPGKMSVRVIVDHTDGSRYEVEATTVGARGYNDAFLNELAKMQPA
jgi:hypothetical protein